MFKIVLAYVWSVVRHVMPACIAGLCSFPVQGNCRGKPDFFTYVRVLLKVVRAHVRLQCYKSLNQETKKASFKLTLYLQCASQDGACYVCLLRYKSLS